VKSNASLAFMRRFAEEMDHLFEEFGLQTGFRMPSFLTRGHELPRREAGVIPGEWSPRIDVLEREGQFAVRADLPGLSKEDVKVDVTDDLVTIQGERKQQKQEECEGSCYSECSYGSFYRAIPLPAGAEVSKATAQFHNGVLEIAMPAPTQGAKEVIGDLRAVFEAADPEAMSLRHTTPRVSGFSLSVEIARGGSGVVYRALPQGLGREVALKVLSPAASDRFRRLMARRAAVIGLRHPNIVAINSIGETDGVWFYAMDLVDGTGLDQRVARRGALPSREAAALVRKIAEAVQSAHTLGVVHGDLKPENILLDRSEEPKIVDFALGISTDDDNPPSLPWQGIGKPGFIAPERATGRARHGTAEDIYSLGAILYFVVTGRPPFRGGTGEEILHQLTTQEPAPPRNYAGEIDRRLESICLKCLKRRPEERYVSAADLAADLAACFLDQPVSPQAAELKAGIPAASQGEGVSARAATSREMPESARHETAEGRRLNVWLEGDERPLVVDLTVKVGVDIGPPREGAIGGGPSPTFDWRGVEYVDLIIALCGADVSVSPPSHRVRLPRVGKSNPALFDVTPRRAGTVELHVDVLRPGDFALLEQYRVSLEVMEAEVAQTA